MIKTIKKVIIIVIGFTVVLIGVAMIVLPGPAVIIIPAGLAILATEFVWARRLLNKMKQQAARVQSAVWKKNTPKEKAKDEVSSPLDK